MSAALVAFTLYLAITVGVGLWASSRSKGDEEDYFLAGRSLSPVSMALSAVSSGRSAWLVVGASAAAWSLGLSAVWLFPGYIVAEAWMFTSLGPRLRRFSESTGAITVPEVLSRAGGTQRLPIRQVAGVILCVFLVTYVSAQLGAGAKTLGGVFAIQGETWGLVLTAGIVLVYTVLGGYRAVVLTDVVQAGFMLCGMVVLPLLGLRVVGGMGELGGSLNAIDPTLLDWTRGGALAVVGGLAIGLGSLGNPHILVRHMSLQDHASAKVAMATGTFWNLVMAAGAFLMGLVGRALHPTTETMLGDGREYLYATLAGELSGELLFGGFVGILLATLFAAIMSTCDSQLLVLASSFVRDFRSKEATAQASAEPPATKAPQRSGIATSRLAVLLALVAAVAIGYGDVPLVNNMVLLAWAALGIAFGPAVLALLYVPRTSERGVLAGMLVGTAMVVVAWWFSARPQGRAITWELVPCFLVTFAVITSLRRR